MWHYSEHKANFGIVLDILTEQNRSTAYITQNFADNNVLTEKKIIRSRNTFFLIHVAKPHGGVTFSSEKSGISIKIPRIG